MLDLHNFFFQEFGIQDGKFKLSINTFNKIMALKGLPFLWKIKNLIPYNRNIGLYYEQNIYLMEMAA